MKDTDKLSGLRQYGINYGRKKFYWTGPGFYKLILAILSGANRGGGKEVLGLYFASRVPLFIVRITPLGPVLYNFLQL